MSVSPLPTALEHGDQVLGGLRVSALAGPVAPLLRDVFELADHAVDLIVGHPAHERGQRDADDVDIFFGFHGRTHRTRRDLATPGVSRSGQRDDVLAKMPPCGHIPTSIQPTLAGVGDRRRGRDRLVPA